MKFAAYVVGVSGGVRIYNLERYMSASHLHHEEQQLTNKRWVLELYRTIIEILQSIVLMLLIVIGCDADCLRTRASELLEWLGIGTLPATTPKIDVARQVGVIDDLVVVRGHGRTHNLFR